MIKKIQTSSDSLGGVGNFPKRGGDIRKESMFMFDVGYVLRNTEQYEFVVYVILLAMQCFYDCYVIYVNRQPKSSRNQQFYMILGA